MTARRTAAVAALVAAIVLLWAAWPAAAHEGDGTIVVLAAEPTGPLEVSYRVRLTFKADGHPAADATVTVVAEGPGAAATTPQPMAPAGEEGVYAASVRFPEPGQWTVRFTAVTPQATAERAETVAAPPTMTTTLSTTTTTDPPTTTAASAGNEGGSDDDGGVPVLPLAAGGVAVAAVAAVLVARRRR